MGRAVHWIDETELLAEQIARVGSGPLALDSEADSFHHYHEKVCLIQLSFGESDLLLDPLAELDLSPLGDLLADRRLAKILHGADYDIRMLQRDRGLEIRGLFDTMVAARLVGERSFGLSALLEKYLDVKLDKRFQRADWSRRPLPIEMKRYAVEDTRHLEALAGVLGRRLDQLGRREWAEEEFGHLESVRWVAERRAEEAFLRVKGIHTLNRAELAAARELAQLRETSARRRDLPPFRILRDDLLLELARRATDVDADPSTIKGLPRAWSRGADRRELLAAFERARKLPDHGMPRLQPRRPRREPAWEKRLRRLRHDRDRLADQLGLEPSVVASRGLLEEALDCLDGGGELEQLRSLRRWQMRLLEPVFEALRG